MRVFFPESWSQVPGVDYSASIPLAAILPRNGQWTHAFFGRDKLPSGRVAHIVWQPPISTYNGCEEQPSEIAQSYLLTVRAGMVSMIDAHRYRYDFEVITCEPLLPALRAFEGDWALESMMDGTTVPPTSCLIWETTYGCGIADVAGLKYLSGRASETYLELLIEYVDGDMFGLLSTHLCPGWDEYYIGRRKLSPRERSGVEAVMQKAVPLVDACVPYLIE